jgi:F-type H+-transporting ATPase subunit delta
LATDELVRGYAQALFSVAEAEGVLDTVGEELFAVSGAIERSVDLRQALTDQALPAENKKAVVRELLGERAHPVTDSLVEFVVAAGRAKELGDIVHELASTVAERRRHVLAEVRTAVPLGEDRRRAIAAALSSATGREVEVQVIVDPTVVGGVVAHVGDEVFDGSVASRLDDAKQQLGS